MNPVHFSELRRHDRRELHNDLLGGDQSPQYLQDGLTTLEGRLAHASRHEFTGLGHEGAWDADPRSNPTGDPATVAKTLVEWVTPDEAEPSTRAMPS